MTPERAQRLAERFYANRFDLVGIPEIEHVRAVAQSVEPFAETVAWLHDIVEDGLVSMEYLVCQGLSQDDARAVALLTRTGQVYREYIESIAAAKGEGGRKAREVKLKDVRHNKSRKRPPQMAGIDRRYDKALAILEAAMEERGELDRPERKVG